MKIKLSIFVCILLGLLCPAICLAQYNPQYYYYNVQTVNLDSFNKYNTIAKEYNDGLEKALESSDFADSEYGQKLAMLMWADIQKGTALKTCGAVGILATNAVLIPIGTLACKTADAQKAVFIIDGVISAGFGITYLVGLCKISRATKWLSFEDGKLIVRLVNKDQAYKALKMDYAY